MTVTSPTRSKDVMDGGRGERTRSAILEASRQLFLERGYGGTRVNAITEVCGISNASFYTYFKDKRQIFNVLGQNAYRDVLAVISELADIQSPIDIGDVQSWVGRYFDFMDRHGAFVLASAHSAPDDDAFRRSRNRMMARVSWKLGQAVARERGKHSPEVIGLIVTGLLEQAWFTAHRQAIAVDRDEVIAAAAEMIIAIAPR